MLRIKTIFNSTYQFQRLFSLYKTNNEKNSMSSPAILNSTIKTLIDKKQYKQAVDLCYQNLEKCTNYTISIAINACNILNDYQRGIDIKEKIPSNALENSYIQTSLIRFYTQCHDIDNALHLFSSITKKNSFIYTAMFKGLISNNMPEKVLDLFDEMTFKPDKFILAVLFNACGEVANDRAMKIGRKLLDDMLNNYRNDIVLLNSAIDMLMKFGDVQGAERIFGSIKTKDIITYNAMMKGYIRNKIYEKSLDLFEQINFNVDDVTYIIVFNACAQLANDRAIKTGKKLLHEMPNIHRNNNVLLTSAIDMLMKFGDVQGAERTFDSIKKKDIITYNAMMKGYVQNEMYEKSLDLVEQMDSNLNHVTYAILFNACVQLANDRAIKIGKKLLHEMSNNYRNNTVLLNSAIDMLMKFGDVQGAERIFDSIKTKDIVSYGAIMKGYIRNEMYEKSLDLFEQINFNVDDVTYIIVFNACAQLANDRAIKIGKKLLHEMPNIHRNNNVLLTSAIDMLMKFGEVENAEHFVKLIRNKNIMTYGALMNGYNINGEPWKCLKIFQEIKQKNIVLNEIIWNLVIGSYSQIGMIRQAEYISNQIPLHIQNEKQIQNSMIHMWGKCGSIVKAQNVFKLVYDPGTVTYNAMINGFGLNGMGSEAIELYREMPNNLHNEISHICVLNACSHSGLLHQAQNIFNEINLKTEKIVTIMVDCLSRLFLFDEALNMIDEYEKKNSPCFVMYMCLLSGARNNRNRNLSEKIYNRMKYLFPDQKQRLGSGVVLLSNIYSSVGEHQLAKNFRSSQIKELGVKVKMGLSWTDANGEIVAFKAHDHSHPQSREIHAEAGRIHRELIEDGYKCDSSWVTRELYEEETIESALCGHSERLAIAFNFIQRPIPEFIQVTKNLRVCGDCHEATKRIARIRQREIIVRDANRIHHFYKNGQCSCQDHF
ncbi:unnamed protein product [Rotaria sordida]|uniref:DYW domain-containing protein n=1 Tax=Rotaria sordida TaxID=392033 RepID=A0A819H355_9BILA|nr:unnamed protein product [Rotaria sordida]